MPPELLMLGTALLALSAYAIFGGADFGAGVWDVLTRRRRSPSERELIYHAIGPVWEANHVWLIFVLMILWSAFPSAFAGMCRVVMLPLLLTLVGIIFRGAAYAFRSIYEQVPGSRQRWEVIFSSASIAAPFFMGAAIGTIAGDNPEVTADGSFHGDWLTGWIRPESIYFGAFAVGICAFMAAVFLNRETSLNGDVELSERWQRRALWSGVITGAMAMGGLVAAWLAMPELWKGMLRIGWIAVAASMVCGLATILLVRAGRASLAAATACITVAAVLAGWGLSQYPLLVAPNVTIAGSAAPDRVQWILLVSIAIGMSLVAPSLWWLLRVFKSQETGDG